MFPRPDRFLYAGFGAFWGFAFGWIVNLWHWLTFVYPLSLQTYAATVAASFWFDFLHATTNAAFFVLIGSDIVNILQRYKRKLSFTLLQPVEVEGKMRTFISRVSLALVLLLTTVSPSYALDAAAPEGFGHDISENNVAGGFDYLPDGDIVALTADFVGGPDLVLIDANGDGVPTSTTTIASFDTTVFGQFVKVSPDGTYALFATSGSVSALHMVELDDFSVSKLYDIIGAFDVAFTDSGHGYLSANTGGFDPSKPNEIFYFDMASPGVLTSVVEIDGTPSGPVALNSSGDLYYVKGTFAFPAPPGSFSLMKFGAHDLATALGSSTPLGEDSAVISATIDGGYDLEINTFDAGNNDIFLSTTGDVVFHTKEIPLAPAPHTVVSDVVSTPSATYLAFVDSAKRFEAHGPNENRLGVSLAAAFFSEFPLLQLFPVPHDPDCDGVTSLEELEYGTDESDSGSVPSTLKSPTFALWNSFLKMINILELVNNGTEDVVISISLFAIDGTSVSTTDIALAPNTQFDIIVNDLPGYVANSYGLLKLEFEGNVDGRVLFYKLGEALIDFEFVFAMPLVNAIYERSAVVFNTYQPSFNAFDLFNVVESWLSIVNLDAEPKDFVVKKYNQKGDLLSTTPVSVAAGARMDLEAGHVDPGPSHVGLMIIEPVGEKGPYLAKLIRYGRNELGGYDFAFSLDAKPGTGRPIVAPVSNKHGARGWLEVANAYTGTVMADVHCYGSDGALVLTDTVELKPLFQLHFDVSSVLAADEIGQCVVDGDTANSLVSQSMRYFRDETGGVLAVTGVQLREALSSGIFGTYNLFLGNGECASYRKIHLII